jgi:hypothetical protein
MKRLIFALALTIAAPAGAHQSSKGMHYDSWCCNGGDCAEIPAKAVKAEGNTLIITLNPGDHPLVTRTHVYRFDARNVKQSQDGEYHACLWPTEDKMRCLYKPPEAF